LKADVVPSIFEWKTNSVGRKLPTARQLLHTTIRNENMPEDEQMMNDGIQISQGAENCVTFSEINCCICFSLRTVFTLQTITFFMANLEKRYFPLNSKYSH
jgi:hypothetical protein